MPNVEMFNRRAIAFYLITIIAASLSCHREKANWAKFIASGAIPIGTVNTGEQDFLWVGDILHKKYGYKYGRTTNFVVYASGSEFVVEFSWQSGSEKTGFFLVEKGGKFLEFASPHQTLNRDQTVIGSIIYKRVEYGQIGPEEIR